RSPVTLRQWCDSPRRSCTPRAKLGRRRRGPLSSSPPEDASFPPWRLCDEPVEPLRCRERGPRGWLRAGRGRARLARRVLQGRGEPGPGRISERTAEVVGDLAARQPGGAGPARDEPVGIVAESLRVYTLELDGEVSGPAIVRRVEAVRLAAGRGSDLDHLHVDAAQPVHDRLARGARPWASDHEHTA